MNDSGRILKWEASAWNPMKPKQEALGSFKIEEEAAVVRDLAVYNLRKQNAGQVCLSVNQSICE